MGKWHRIKHVHFYDARRNVFEQCKKEGKSFLQSFVAGMFIKKGDGWGGKTARV